MKTTILALLILSILSMRIHAQTNNTTELTITIDKISKVKGTLYVKLHNSEQGYIDDKPFKIQSKKVTDQTQVIIFEHVPYGEYGLVWHQDINDNEKFDTNFMGIPKEPYGFSNNERGRFGPPKYKKIRFTVNSDSTKMDLTAD